MPQIDIYGRIIYVFTGIGIVNHEIVSIFGNINGYRYTFGYTVAKPNEFSIIACERHNLIKDRHICKKSVSCLKVICINADSYVVKNSAGYIYNCNSVSGCNYVLVVGSSYSVSRWFP